jgi:hypothetical protein
MRKIKIITFLAIIFSIATLKGQDNMIIHLVDNSNIKFAIDNIERITFNDANMFLKTISGIENSYLLDNINSITFSDDVNGIYNFTENIEVNVYINASGEIVAESQHPISKLTVFDISGRVIKTTNRNSINIGDISIGVYLLRVETAQGIITKKFIKNR